MRHFISVLITLMLLVVMVLPAAATPWELRGGVDLIGPNQQIAGDLFFSGDTLEVEGEVRGDLVVFARQVMVSGRVTGNIVGLVTDRLVIEGEVAGDIRVLAGHMVIEGAVGQMVSAYGLRLTTAPNSRVATGILGAFGALKLTGTVAGPVEVRVWGDNQIGGRIGSDLISRGAPIQWLAPITVNGRVDEYSVSPAKPEVADGIEITRGYHFHRVKTDSPLLFRWILMASLVWFLGSLLLSLIFYRIFPRTTWAITSPTLENLRRSILTGTITLFGIPLLIVILFLTTVGLPLALVLFLLYLALLILAGVPFNILLGRIVFRQYREVRPAHPNLLVVTGCLLASLFSILPYIGLVLPTCLGMGMIVRLIKPEFKDDRFGVQK
ncbi:MAG TPA: polymer-forming cytoskeletal protein [Bacillota bacterium]